MRSQDQAVRRLVNAVRVPGLCGDVLPPWMEQAADDGLVSVCWFSGDSRGELTSRQPGRGSDPTPSSSTSARLPIASMGQR